MPRIAPQPGPQKHFLASPADIAIYGGAAGGGKSWALLLEPLRHVRNKNFNAVIFRRNLTQVTNPGGLWDESARLYPQAGAKPQVQSRSWQFRSGARVRFAHLEHESTVYAWQGAQIALLGFDELTHFSRHQFFYMLSRNRTIAGMRPYVRATCNPDADSWVAELIAWWIDPATGFPIPERAGRLRWFVRVADAFEWADTREALLERSPASQPKSMTFIPARLDDNPALTKADPGYRANLLALPTVERERLLNGNWKIRPAAGLLFSRRWCATVDALPAGLRFVRYWDLAATPRTAHNDPDWTVGVKLGRGDDGTYVVADVVRLQGGPGDVERLIAETAARDGKAVRIGLPQDPGQAGKMQASYLAKQLAGYSVTARPESGDKVTRFGPFSAQARIGHVTILRGPWTEDFLAALEAFPEARHDDDADAAAGAFALFHDATDGLIDFYGRAARQRDDKES
jgi:predicted phage terminase large subunit-like protein